VDVTCTIDKQNNKSTNKTVKTIQIG